MSKIKIGTRGSKLAMWQAEEVRRKLSEVHPELETELVVIHTKGDKILDTALSKIGDKGLFTRELEQALLDSEIDIAVHSLKDMPTELPEGLMLEGCWNVVRFAMPLSHVTVAGYQSLLLTTK